MNKTHLNLARKWRPQTFDQIVGQDISVKILKNSLYLKKLFPVYLFAGQRGCGKTSTARVFAAAINCQMLPVFQEKPTEQVIPCLNCQSCKAMTAANHSDFIEIDAASHTGVDNVRQIIESSSYVPLSGKKKIYLIDEAHMLSKAAFNAFLKILEDPPETVHFILATTELQKFPQTVLSRCFQLFFGPLENTSLQSHLKNICKKEQIIIDDDALDVLIDETDGSARDALNLLEQVRFSGDRISTKTILHVLGKVSNSTLIYIFECILSNDSKKLLDYLPTISFIQLSPQSLWNMLLELCRALLWIKHGVEKIPNTFNKNFDALIELASQCSLNRLHAIMQLLWTQESLFLQTDKKHTFLELLLIQLCSQTTIDIVQKQIQQYQTTASNLSQAPILIAEPSPVIQKKTSEIRKNNLPSPSSINSQPQPSSTKKNSKKNDGWQHFVEKINSVNDRLLASIMMQASFLGEKEDGSITLQLSSNSKFFRDKLADSTKVWKPKLLKSFPNFLRFNFVDKKAPETKLKPTHNHTDNTSSVSYAVDQQQIKQNTQPTAQYNLPPTNKNIRNYTGQSSVINRHTPAINISDKEKWPLANLIISLFPGKIKTN